MVCPGGGVWQPASFRSPPDELLCAVRRVVIGAGQGAAQGSGCDAGQLRSREANIKGRKRRILADTCGNLLGVLVTPASAQDRDTARVACCLCCHLLLCLRIIFADGGYAGKLEAIVAQAGRLFGHAAGLAIFIIKRGDKTHGFQVLPKRRVVERAFGWLDKQRRLVRYHERNPRHHEALVYLAMIGHSLRSPTHSPI